MYINPDAEHIDFTLNSNSGCGKCSSHNAKNLFFASLFLVPTITPSLTFNEVLYYGQMYTLQTNTSSETGMAYTGGVYLSVDWYSDPMNIGPSHFGLVTECGAGLGYAPWAPIGLDLIGDLLGLAYSYKVSESLQVGLMYEPFEIYVMPIGGFIGSKMMIKGSYGKFQTELARGANRWGNGWALPQSDALIYTASLQYLTASDQTFGLRIVRSFYNASRGTGLMLFWGASI